MKATTLLLILFLGGALRANAADQATTTNMPVKTSTNWQDFRMDADDRAMIDSWPKGLPTNGLYCALQFVRHGGVNGSGPSCAAYVINTTTNLFRSLLNLPGETIFQVELLDSEGKPVEKTAAGKLFKTWTQKQMEDWCDEQDRNRSRGKFIMVWPLAFYQVGSLGIAEIFQAKRSGEYTLHLRMQLVEAKLDASKNLTLQPTWLPEVVAKVQIRPEDIPHSDTPPSGQTNTPAR
jgi:hypothetical protein